MKRAILPFLLILSLLLCGTAAAEDAGGSAVIVSLGDSYSSGEGNEPFYGQEAEMAVRCQDPDWLAHRSGNSWPGMLTLPAVDGPMKEHRGTHWFFVASSGAEANHLFLLTDEDIAAGLSAEQEKKYDRDGISGTAMLPPQLDIFDELDARGLKADYVTLSIGGNDINFKELVASAMAGTLEYYPGSTVEEKAENLMQTLYSGRGVRDRIRRVFTDVAARAGSQACILVVGYPRPIAPEGGGQDGFPPASAQVMNAAASMFNAEIGSIVEECRAEGMNIWFVSVEEAFEGHGAYSDDPYINPIIDGACPQDLKSFQFVSSYSMHPNLKGIEAYARCVQEVIDRLEAEK